MSCGTLAGTEIEEFDSFAFVLKISVFATKGKLCRSSSNRNQLMKLWPDYSRLRNEIPGSRAGWPTSSLRGITPKRTRAGILLIFGT